MQLVAVLCLPLANSGVQFMLVVHFINSPVCETCFYKIGIWDFERSILSFDWSRQIATKR
jgi:hypothetical protein